MNEAARIWDSRNPEKKLCHIAVNNAVRLGKLTKGPCEVCGDEDVHGHHDDYSKPLDVRWLCRSHHKALHEALRMPSDLTNEGRTCTKCGSWKIWDEFYPMPRGRNGTVSRLPTLLQRRILPGQTRPLAC